MPMISTEAAISEIISVAPDPPTTPAKVATTHRTQTTATLETSYCGRISLGPLGKQRGRSKLLSQLLCRCWHKTLIAQTSLFSFCSSNARHKARRLFAVALNAVDRLYHIKFILLDPASALSRIILGGL